MSEYLILKTKPEFSTNQVVMVGKIVINITLYMHMYLHPGG